MGGSGTQATNAINSNWGAQNLYNAPRALSDPAFQDILANYGSGKTSLADALSAAKGQDPAALRQQVNEAYNQMWADNHAGKFNHPGTGRVDEGLWKAAQDRVSGMQNQLQKAEEDARSGPDKMNAIFSNPLTGTKAATEQVMGNEVFKPYLAYGQGLIGENEKVQGLLDESRNALMGRDESYGLTGTDLKALGQTSDATARLYGSQEQSLAQMLADRGLSQAPSGAATQAYSGLLGNKNEQLAKAQLGIAQSRIDTARGLANDRMNADLQRHRTVQGSIEGMGRLAGQAVNDQFSRNMQGLGNYQQQNKDSMGAAQTMQDQYNQQFQQQQATKGPSFGDILGGLGTGLIGTAAGGFGGAFGAGLGKSIFNPKTKGNNWNSGNEESPNFIGPRQG